MTKYTQLINDLENLGLIKIKSYLPEFLDHNKKNSTVIISALQELCSLELQDKIFRVSENLIRTAAFPFRKTLDDFDFSFNDSIDKDYIMDLATLRFAEDNKNILFLGNPGVGKTHLTVALGILASAILDRLLDQAYVVKIVGESYRTKYLAVNKKSAG